MMMSYPATVLRVVDADTLECDLDLGFHLHYLAKVRLARINAPEMNTQAGVEAKAYVSLYLPPKAKGTVSSHSLDKYGRVLGDFTLLGATQTLSALLLAHGHAQEVT